MGWHVYAMDTGFYSSLGSYSFEARCEIARELGFDAAYVTLWSEPQWADVPKLATVRERYGLDVAAVYTAVDLSSDDDSGNNRRILDLVEAGVPGGRVEVALVGGEYGPSDERGDDEALRRLERLVERAERSQTTLLLYPHALCWLERTEDAARLCRRLDHPLVKAIFTTYHWYAVDGTRLRERLQDVSPYLASVNICGSRRVKGWVMPATIERLDDGELDTFAVMHEVKRVGYQGMVGIQGYSLAGDPYAKFQRSLAVFRDIERRLEQHPTWGELRVDDPLPLPSGA